MCKKTIINNGTGEAKRAEKEWGDIYHDVMKMERGTSSLFHSFSESQEPILSGTAR